MGRDGEGTSGEGGPRMDDIKKIDEMGACDGSHESRRIRAKPRTRHPFWAKMAMLGRVAAIRRKRRAARAISR